MFYNILHPNSYLLTPWCRVLLEKLTGLQLVKKFPAFYGTRRFITALTNLHHLSLSWTSPIQSIYPHPTSWRSILILSTHLRLGLLSGLFPPVSPPRPYMPPSSHPYAPHAQPISLIKCSYGEQKFTFCHKGSRDVTSLKSTRLNVYEESVSIGGKLTMLFILMLMLQAICTNKFQHYALFCTQYM